MGAERRVRILRCFDSGDLLVNPQGTFVRFGAWRFLHSLIVVKSDDSAESLGHAVLEGLAHSGPTGLKLEDYLARPIDPRFENLFKRYRTEDRRVQLVSVVQRGRTKFDVAPFSSPSGLTRERLAGTQLTSPEPASIGMAVRGYFGPGEAPPLVVTPTTRASGSSERPRSRKPKKR